MIIKKLLIITVIYFISISTSQASLNDEIDSFLGGSLGGNTTAPAHWEGKNAQYYSAGSLYSRSQIKTVNPVNIRLPNLTAGCGGIDLYAGGFSFINEDQLMSLMKAIVANSKGFALKAALGLIAPSFEGWMDDLQKIVQKVNNFNINSCDAAQAAIGGLASFNDKTSRAFCKTKGNSSGQFTDYAEGWAKCDSEGAALTQASSKEDQNAGAPPRNLTWNILTKNEGDSLDATTISYYELLMTLTGTYVMRKDPVNSKHHKGIASDNNTIDILMNGGTLEVYKCDTKDMCLEPIKENVTISEEESFQGRVKKMISDIRDKIIQERAGGVQSLSDSEKNFINDMPYGLPILKIIETQQAYKKHNPVFSMDGLEDWIALGLIYDFIRQSITQVEQDTYFNTASGKDEKIIFLKNLDSTKQTIAQKSTELDSKLAVIQDKMKMIKSIETYVNSSGALPSFKQQ